MLSLFNLIVQKAYAAPPVIQPIGSPIAGTADPTTLINNIYTQVLTIMTVLAGALAAVYLIYAGIQYITANGNADRAKAARSGVVNAVFGIAVIVAAYAIMRVGISIGAQLASTEGLSKSGTETSGGIIGDIGNGNSQASYTGNTGGSGSTGGTGGTGGTGSGNGSTASYQVTVEVKNLNTNALVKGAAISVNNKDRVNFPKGTTGSDGRVKFSMSEKGSLRMKAQASGYQTCADYFNFQEGFKTTILLAPGTSSGTAEGCANSGNQLEATSSTASDLPLPAPVDGENDDAEAFLVKAKVVNLFTGQALSSASISLTAPGGEQFYKGTTNSEGTASFIVDNMGVLPIQVSRNGYKVCSDSINFGPGIEFTVLLLPEAGNTNSQGYCSYKVTKEPTETGGY